MATNSTPTPTPAVPAKPKTVAEDMLNRRIFSTEMDDKGVVTKTAVQAAEEYLNGSAESFSDFGSIPLAAVGLGTDDAGNTVFDPAIYTESMDVAVSLLRNKQKVKALVIAPFPTMDALMSRADGLEWVTKIIRKELSHVSVRALREAEDVSTVVDQMPVNIDGYLASGRGDGGIIESFNELYKALLNTLGQKIPVFARARLIKGEFRKALESKGYATEVYPALEDYRGESLFALALKLAIDAAKRKGMDPTIFERWAATRDQKVYTGTESDGEDDALDISSLVDDMLDDDSDDSTKTTDAPDASVETVTDSTADAPTTEPAE